ncbi:uncharacterized protein LOC110665732 [Hevea brasiliensis]|uniref:uncharacterized protein LOC110665732 n=1 Tax=Hevea brasiliensis TaxID=3981 RepID=UPI0025E4B860|nr:uncharacterized protein LOC110665732 [Hevea brasiliensis]
MDLQTNKVYVSRDVIFFDTSFPFNNTTLSSVESSTPILPFPISSPTSHHTDTLLSTLVPELHSFLPPLRRSTRLHQQPSRLKDFVVASLSYATTSVAVFYSSPVSKTQEPVTYLQAITNTNWIEVMNQELQALEKNGTWELCELPKRKKAIGSKWVFKVKYKPDGEKWPIYQLDINNAFLHGCLDEEVYMRAPDGYTKALPGQVAQSETGTLISQKKFILDVLKETGMTAAKAVSMSLLKGLHLAPDDGELLTDPDKFRSLIGRLLYVNITRPDITYSVQHLSQFMGAPGKPHWDAALHLLRYFKLGSCVFSRKSFVGFAFFFGDAWISWKTKKQNTVFKSSAEAEYRSMAATVCELLWVSYILDDLRVIVQLPISLKCDNEAAIHNNPIFHERAKHLDIDCQLVREQLQCGFILPSHVSSVQQLVDLFTKPLLAASYHSLVSKLGLVCRECAAGQGRELYKLVWNVPHLPWQSEQIFDTCIICFRKKHLTILQGPSLSPRNTAEAWWLEEIQQKGGGVGVGVWWGVGDDMLSTLVWGYFEVENSVCR